MQLQKSVLNLFFIATTASAVSSCAEGYSLCSPTGASSTSVPQIGSSDFTNLYTDILQSSLPSIKLKRSESGTASLCCNALLSCLLLANLSIPFCYDKFTTNFFLPDGSYGTLFSGVYISSEGDTANLTTGVYTLSNGETGNIYTSGTPTLTNALPSQFTASGIGSAIPASSLGRKITITYTTTLPGTTIPAVTVKASISYTTIQETVLYPVTIEGNVVASTSVEISTKTVTVPGTTVAAVTSKGEISTVTTTTDAATSASNTSTTKENDARGLVTAGTVMWAIQACGMLFFLGC